MKTAVEWLIEARFGSIKDCTPMFRAIIKQAKQMEKEQIMDAWNDGQSNGATVCTQKVDNPSEQYYNETYKNTNE